MPTDGGLGASLVGEKIAINQRHVAVVKLLGEGGFSFVYLVREIADSLNNTVHGESVQRSNSGSGTALKSGSNGSNSQSGRSGSMGNGVSRRQGSLGAKTDSIEKKEMVLKVTSILSRQQRDIAEKEAKLLSRLSHPSIIKIMDACYRTVPHPSSSSTFRKMAADDAKQKERPQHMILMEFCEGGHALEVCTKMAAAGERFDLSALIIAFGQICNAVSYLHAQRPPIVHRDLKPANFLIKNGAYKLCDFGSAVFGHVELKTSQARAEAEEVIQKTTTQMFRAPEMVDLYMAKKLTQATDVWALGCCLYSLAYLQNCFEEGSNLAILSRKYKIPEDNPYGDGLVELIDRMLTVDSKARADMTEVILCLSAVYSGRPLPPRKERPSKSSSGATGSSSKDKDREKKTDGSSTHSKAKKKKNERAGTFRTDGQGIYDDGVAVDLDPTKKVEAKKLDPNSAAARRRLAAGGDSDFASFHSRFDEAAAQASNEEVNQDLAFSTTDNPFAAFDQVATAKTDHHHHHHHMRGEPSDGDIFGSFETDPGGNGSQDDEVAAAFGDEVAWGGGADAFASFSPEEGAKIEDACQSREESGADVSGETTAEERRRRSSSGSRRRTTAPLRRKSRDIRESGGSTMKHSAEELMASLDIDADDSHDDDELDEEGRGVGDEDCDQSGDDDGRSVDSNDDEHERRRPSRRGVRRTQSGSGDRRSVSRNTMRRAASSRIVSTPVNTERRRRSSRNEEPVEEEG